MFIVCTMLPPHWLNSLKQVSECHCLSEWFVCYYYNREIEFQRPSWRDLRWLLLCPESEVNQCPTNLSVPVLIPAAVGLLYVSNTVPSIKKRWTNIKTSSNETLLPINDTVVLGSVSVTATSSRILSVRSARSKASSHLLKRYTTSFHSPKAVAMRRAISWLFVNPATLELLPRVVTGGGGQISKTF